jgi:pimeloyl-ACP methyl ester carboxylesterase
MSTFVLVHGAWHGGWCWARVAERLRKLKHTVFTPTLAGMGEHAHLLTREITLATHVEDVASFIRIHDLREVVLVGHSYGGIAITGAADMLDVEARIAQLVYLDALVPRDGDGWFSFHKPEQIEARHAAGYATDGLYLPVPDAAVFGMDSAQDTAWVQQHLRPHPYGCYTSRIALPALANGRGAAALKRRYIDCVQPLYSDFNGLKARLRQDPGFEVIELGTGHNAMVSAPDALCALLSA